MVDGKQITAEWGIHVAERSWLHSLMPRWLALGAVGGLVIRIAGGPMAASEAAQPTIFNGPELMPWRAAAGGG